MFGEMDFSWQTGCLVLIDLKRNRGYKSLKSKWNINPFLGFESRGFLRMARLHQHDIAKEKSKF